MPASAGRSWRDRLRIVFLLGVLAPALIQTSALKAQNPRNPGGIRPWTENPFYWQYQGEPVLLLGGSDDDNLFQWPGDKLRPQLDKLKAAGGNYVRNTMSDRRDGGWELYPFQQRADGKYDLDRWNPEYWRRFEQFLRWTSERDIIVQIEIWDRFDYSREHWPPHPYNPANNVNYTFGQSGFSAEYPEHPGQNRQPFFFTTPRQRDNRAVLKYQQRFVEKMLSYSLKYGHVLYCIDNETKADEEWGRYWAQYVKDKARQAGVAVYVTEMWDDWDLKAERHRQTLDHPELYDFVDVSQNNHNSGHKHWDNALWVRQYLAGRPRPINTVKTYGADRNRFGHSDQDGIERFVRHVLAGFASARFHRPDSGLGLNAKAEAAIRAMRKVESVVKLWNAGHVDGFLTRGEESVAYAAGKPGQHYIIYFPDGGAAGLNCGPGRFAVRWIDVNAGEWGPQAELQSNGVISLSAPAKGNWLAIMLRGGSPPGTP
jgi:hypothetical protein